MGKVFRLMISAIIVSSCGVGSQTDEIEDQVVTRQKDLGEKTSSISDTTVPGSLVLDTGPAAGTSLNFEAGALPEGTELKAAATSTPSEFSNLDLAPSASAAIEVKASNNGEDLAAAVNPMTLAIPMAATTLALVENTDANLCALLKSSSGLFVWRPADVTIDTAARKATIKTLYFGVFQLAYCGNESLPGFKEASSEGVIAQSISLSLSVDGGKYHPNSAHLCAALLMRSTEPDGGDRGPDTIIAALSAPNATDGTTTIKLEYSGDKIPANKIYYLLSMGKSNTDTCGGATLQNLLTGMNENYVFEKTSAQLAGAGSSINYALGDENHALTARTLTIGVPSESVVSAASASAISVCANYEGTDDKAFSEFSLKIDADGKVSGSDSVTLYSPPSVKELRMYFGEDCSDSGDYRSNTPTPSRFPMIVPSSSLSEPQYIVPVKMKLEATAEAMAAGLNKACMNLYPAGSIDSTGAFTGTGATESMSYMAVETGIEYPLLIPWIGNGKKNNVGTPLYDMSLDFNVPSCTGEKVTPIDIPKAGLTDRPLNPTFGG